MTRQKCYSEWIGLLQLIHRLTSYGDSSCIDSLLFYFPEEQWIALYRVVMETFLRTEPNTFGDSGQL